MQTNLYPSGTFLDAAILSLKRVENGCPSLIVGSEIFHNIRIRLAFPLSDENRYIAFFNEQDDYIGIVESLEELSSEARQIVDAELRWRYVTPQITKVHQIRNEDGLTTLRVETDRGPVTIKFKGLRENVTMVIPGRMVITDEFENRYEIRDIHRLDPHSRRILQRMV